MQLLERAAFLEALDGYVAEAAAGNGRFVTVTAAANGGRLDALCRDDVDRRHLFATRALKSACMPVRVRTPDPACP